MPLTKTACLSAIALVAVAAPAFAQQFLAAPGIAIIVSPAQPASQAQPMPDAFQVMNAQMSQMNAMMQQMDAQMSAQMNALSQLPTTPAAFNNLPAGVTGISITTITDGSKSCTERVLYPATGAQQISETGNSCAALHLGQPAGPIPSALPTAPVQSKAPTTIVVRNDSTQEPIRLADRD
jgi:hypothetical protein